MSNLIQSHLSNDILSQHLEIAIALACPKTHQLIEYNQKFHHRCIEPFEALETNDNISTVIPTINIDLLVKVLKRGRKYRFNQLYSKLGMDYPVDFTFTLIELNQTQYILIQGVDNRQSLDIKNMVNAYDLIFQSQTQQLAQEKEKSTAAIQVKSKFLSRISHELRTPMNAIIGFAQLQSFQLRDEPKVAENNDQILAAGFELLDLIEKMFDYVEMEDHELAVKLSSCELDFCIDKSLLHYQELMCQYHITVNHQTTGLIVKADEERLIQILKELLSNAIKFNQREGLVNILINQVNENSVDITFEDTGNSLTLDEEQQLLEPFFRSHYAEVNEIPGIGIGLVLSQKMANMMEGNIKFQRNSHSNNQGMSFSLTLKLA